MNIFKKTKSSPSYDARELYQDMSKVFATIRSCVTVEQLDCAVRLLQNYGKKWNVISTDTKPNPEYDAFFQEIIAKRAELVDNDYNGIMPA